MGNASRSCQDPVSRKRENWSLRKRKTKTNYVTGAAFKPVGMEHFFRQAVFSSGKGTLLAWHFGRVKGNVVENGPWKTKKKKKPLSDRREPGGLREKEKLNEGQCSRRGKGGPERRNPRGDLRG